MSDVKNGALLELTAECALAGCTRQQRNLTGGVFQAAPLFRPAPSIPGDAGAVGRARRRCGAAKLCCPALLYLRECRASGSVRPMAGDAVHASGARYSIVTSSPCADRVWPGWYVLFRRSLEMHPLPSPDKLEKFYA